jgi:hypothetical protein
MTEDGSRGDDPSEAIDDPFAELGEGVGADDAPDRDAPDPRPDGAPEAGRSDPFDELGPPDTRGGDPVSEATGDWDDEGDLDDAFEQMDVAGSAEEDVWEALDADVEGDGLVSDAGLGAATAVRGEGDVEHVVAKRTYCQQCPHFTAPPEVACSHEGTTIVEAVGFDEFRVRNCPMISEEDPTFDADG